MSSYLCDPQEIYRRSFAIVREEAALDDLPPGLADIAVRLIHACGMPDIVSDLAYSADFDTTARAALRAGCAIVTDVRMTEVGIIRTRLPAQNTIACAIGDKSAADEAKRRGTTRAAVAIEKLANEWAGGILAIGSAPTALFRALKLIEDGAPPPAAILGFPVGFVGAAESKEALAAADTVPFITVRGRRGGSALAAAAINALAAAPEA